MAEVRFNLSPDEYAALVALAKKDKKDPIKYARERLRHIIKQDGADDLSPREASKLLGVGIFTVRRLMKEKEFPNLYYISQRAIRIPRTDIERYRVNRLPYVKEERWQRRYG